MNVTLHDGYVPGCIGQITQLHARYYHDQAGFGIEFESKVAGELATFCSQYDDRRDGLWLALVDNVVHGSIAIDGSQAASAGAHLRWFITSETTRGTGTGTALLTSALAFCDSHNYPRVYLNTFEGLAAARHLYGKFGFRLVHQAHGNHWGGEVTEQRFERAA